MNMWTAWRARVGRSGVARWCAHEALPHTSPGGEPPETPAPFPSEYIVPDSEESVKGSQAAPTRAPLTDSSESGTRFSDEGKGALVQATTAPRAQDRLHQTNLFSV